MEYFQYGKQIGKFLDQQNWQKRPQGPEPIFLGLEYEKAGNLVPNFEKMKNIIKMLTKIMCRMAVTKRAHEVPA